MRTMTRAQVSIGTSLAKEATRQTIRQVIRPALEKHRPPPGLGDWITGVAVGAGGARRYRLYRPPGVLFSERLPLLVMLHGCHQDAKGFALSTRMNRLAARERFLVLYPEQDRHANPQGCWNWYDTRSGLAFGEAGSLMAALDQVCLLYPVDARRVGIAGLSAGASMAALLATRHPERFRAVVMHSGVAPGVASSSATALGAMHGRRPAAHRPAPANAGAWPPLRVIQGENDAVVSRRAGLAAVEVWAEATGARAVAPRRVQRGKRYETTVTDFKRHGRVVVSLCEVGGLGHAWSGGAAKLAYSDPRGPDASLMAWAFVARQFAD